MEENKYYTPELEEFHIGFEYEWLDEHNIWHKEETPLEITKEGFKDQTYGLRVKYLDKEDIESLGWVYNYLTKDFELSIQGRTDTSIFEYWLTLEDFNSTKGYRLTIDGEDNENSFNGVIKNKSQLKKLMKQLNICQD